MLPNSMLGPQGTMPPIDNTYNPAYGNRQGPPNNYYQQQIAPSQYAVAA